MNKQHKYLENQITFFILYKILSLNHSDEGKKFTSITVTMETGSNKFGL